jgi:5'-nucleotidase
MHLLLTNDDGINAIGLQLLYQSLKNTFEQTVDFSDILISVVAPSHNRSGMSQALTLNQPLTIESLAPHQWQVLNGTPADCVHLSFTGAISFAKPITHVISGINHGVNLGDDTLYSGTVGGAIEGTQFGCHGYAFSFECPKEVDNDFLKNAFKPCITWVTEFIKQEVYKTKNIEQSKTSQPLKPQLWNINYPKSNNSNDVQPLVKITRLGKRGHAKSTIKINSPRGGEHFWIGQAGDPSLKSPAYYDELLSKNHSFIPTDFQALKENCISMTPLQTDLTDWRLLQS